MPEGKTITVDLGEMQDSFDARMASGAYKSADELMQEALRALEREEEPEFDDEFLREKVEEALADRARTFQPKRCSSAWSGCIART